MSLSILKCGHLIWQLKMENYMFQSKENAAYDKAEMLLYEEVTLMKPFRRKTLVIIGTGGVGR